MPPYTFPMRPASITALLVALLAGQRAVLGEKLLGVYLRGSLVTGDFDPQSSDVDLFCVVSERLSNAEFDALARMHERLGARPHPYAREVELAYVPRESARRWRPGEIHPTLGRGERLQWKEHGGNWLLERAVLVRAGQTLHGPPPGEFIDPVPDEDIRQAVLARLKDWRDFAQTPADPAWQGGRGHAAYCIETICRALHTLNTGELSSKPAAVAWAMAYLPQPWRRLVETARAWRNDSAFDSEANRQAQAFIVWATAANQYS